MNQWIKVKSVGYGATVSGATSGCTSCCHVTLAKSQACFDYLHPQNARIAPNLDHIWLLGFLRKMERDHGHLHDCNRNFGKHLEPFQTRSSNSVPRTCPGEGKTVCTMLIY